MKNTIKLDNPVQINGKSYDELTYDISEITAQAFAEADARKLSASGSKNGQRGRRGRAGLRPAPLPRLRCHHRHQPRDRHLRPRARPWLRRYEDYEDRPGFYFREVGGTLHPRQLRRAIRDYARAFHTSTRDLGERRLTDFLTEYGEAVEEAKRLQASRPTRAANFKKPHIRRR